MQEIDFEKIRLDAVDKILKNVKDDVYGDMVRAVTDASSRVTREMLIEFSRQLSEDCK